MSGLTQIWLYRPAHDITTEDVIGCKPNVLMCRLSCIWPRIFLSQVIQNALRTSAIWKGFAGSRSGGGPWSKGWGWLEGLHYDSDYGAFCAILYTLYSNAAEIRHPQNLPLLRGRAALGQLFFFGAFCSLRLVLFCSCAIISERCKIVFWKRKVKTPTLPDKLI